MLYREFHVFYFFSGETGNDYFSSYLPYIQHFTYLDLSRYTE